MGLDGTCRIVADGGAWASRGSDGQGIGIEYREDFECPSDHGYAWVDINGYGDEFVEVDVSPTKGKNKLVDGYAEGEFSQGNYSYGICGGPEVLEPLDLAGATITIDMTGTGGFVKTTWSNSTNDPSGSKNHRRDRALERMATGTVTVSALPSWSWEGDGAIGQYSWSQHGSDR